LLKKKQEKMKILSRCLLFCLAIELCLGLPFRKSDSGVKLQGREKVHGEGEKCPTGVFLINILLVTFMLFTPKKYNFKAKRFAV